MTSFADKAVRHWFITGASGGLGRQLTGHALRQGDRVTATVRRPTALDELRAEYGDRLAVEILDVTHPADIDAVTGRVLAAGPVDVVVNNAGYSVVGATEEMTHEQVGHQLETLLHAPIRITRAFLKPMREQGGGRIIQISSMGGQMGAPIGSAYHAGKWGLEGFTEGVSREVAGFGIHFTLVEPGGTSTGFLSGLNYTTETDVYRDSPVGEMRRWLQHEAVLTGDPAKVAAAVYDTTRLAVPPLRLTLGADSYEAVHAALTERIGELEAQKDLAASVAFTD
ncbi:SDR family oxidoreductase [Amycolatopsis saalfeldensis]|uniref:Short-chain dehydrogenase n=1 Tax=Amycolatopsis saalfeldensis TaxID=394193 RepID=A0A1H8TB88_9PSEU|nr:SDR family oxidoreductase [Amycolatopsis saalfeldensis]SEO87743.1 Short-chain dehydrogenase [Amycolatopsis saalfeldensis]